jgi:hypothetical protein
MLKIDNLHISTPKIPIADSAHPFYQETIKHLYGIDLTNNLSEISTRNRESLVSELRKTLENKTASFRYFLDIRFQEELSSPSPQYAILSDLGCSSVTPICFCGGSVEIVNEGLSALDSLLKDEERALCAISLLSSAEWQYEGPEFIITFIAESDGKHDGLINIVGRIGRT